jgi:hemolysin III
VAIVAVSQLLKLPVAALALIFAGGLAYTLGGVAYALKRPDPFPRVFGYHEIFHVLTLVAAGLQYAAIAFYVLPRG